MLVSLASTHTSDAATRIPAMNIPSKLRGHILGILCVNCFREAVHPPSHLSRTLLQPFYLKSFPFSSSTWPVVHNNHSIYPVCLGRASSGASSDDRELPYRGANGPSAKLAYPFPRLDEMLLVQGDSVYRYVSHRRASHVRVPHRRISHGRAPHGHASHRRVPHKRAFHGRVSHWVCTSQACVLYSCILQACIL
jgi:hypothetical protein